MAYELKDGQGSLFRNDKREKDSQPNATGTAMIGGVKYRVSAWTKDGQKGKWQSLSFKPFDEPSYADRRDPKPLRHELDDEVPF